MMRFGPSGNSESFYAAGHQSSLEAPAWLKAMGLGAWEYSFGRGITLSAETAAKIGAEAARCGLALSVHAPYYINLANPDPLKREQSLRYITQSAQTAKIMGADRVVVLSHGKIAMDGTPREVFSQVEELRALTARAEKRIEDL